MAASSEARTSGERLHLALVFGWAVLRHARALIVGVAGGLLFAGLPLIRLRLSPDAQQIYDHVTVFSTATWRHIAVLWGAFCFVCACFLAWEEGRIESEKEREAKEKEASTLASERHAAALNRPNFTTSLAASLGQVGDRTSVLADLTIYNQGSKPSIVKQWGFKYRLLDEKGDHYILEMPINLAFSPTGIEQIGPPMIDDSGISAGGQRTYRRQYPISSSLEEISLRGLKITISFQDVDNRPYEVSAEFGQQIGGQADARTTPVSLPPIEPRPLVTGDRLSEPRPNIVFVGCEAAYIYTDPEAEISHWRIIEVPVEESVPAALAVFQNRARGYDEPRVITADEVTAQIQYEMGDGTKYLVDRGIWIDRISPTTIHVGETVKLILADAMGAPDADACLFFTTDQRQRSFEHSYLMSPPIHAEAVATIILTVDGIALSPVKIGLRPPHQHHAAPEIKLITSPEK